MDYERMGRLIAQRRREKGLTQRRLAEKLGVTDKAVSKWERGLSCPDVPLLLPLADELGVTVDEVLRGRLRTEGETESAGLAPAPAEEKTERRLHRWAQGLRRRALPLGTVICLAGAALCLAGDMIAAHRLTWSPAVLVTLLYGWWCLLAAPLRVGEKWKGTAALRALTLTTIPYLVLLGAMIRVKQVATLGSAAALVLLAALWVARWMFGQFRGRPLRAWACTIILFLPVPFLLMLLGIWLAEDLFGVLAVFGQLMNLYFFLGVPAVALLFLLDALAGRREQRPPAGKTQ